MNNIKDLKEGDIVKLNWDIVGGKSYACTDLDNGFYYVNRIKECNECDHYYSSTAKICPGMIQLISVDKVIDSLFPRCFFYGKETPLSKLFETNVKLKTILDYKEYMI